MKGSMPFIFPNTLVSFIYTRWKKVEDSLLKFPPRKLSLLKLVLNAAINILKPWMSAFINAVIAVINRIGILPLLKSVFTGSRVLCRDWEPVS